MFSLTYKLFQGSKLCSNEKRTGTANGNIVLDQRMKTRKGWVARVKFIHERMNEKAHLLKELIAHSKKAGILMAISYKQ